MWGAALSPSSAIDGIPDRMSSRTNQLGKATSSVGTQTGRKGTWPQAEGRSGSTEQLAVPGVGVAP